jgi:hypothetical protein
MYIYTRTRVHTYTYICIHTHTHPSTHVVTLDTASQRAARKVGGRERESDRERVREREAEREERERARARERERARERGAEARAVVGLGGVGNTHVSVLLIRRHVLSHLVSFGVPLRGASLGLHFHFFTHSEVTEEDVGAEIAGVGAKRAPERYERNHLKTSSDKANAEEREAASGWRNVLSGV